MEYPFTCPKLDSRGELHGVLFSYGYNGRMQSDFWVASNPNVKGCINLKFNDTNRISALFNANDCRTMAKALLHVADELDKIPK